MAFFDKFTQIMFYGDSERFIYLNESLYKVASSDENVMHVWRADINSEYIKISPSTNSPKNRKQFSICKIDDSNILVVGGTNDDILYNEVWLYSIDTSQWKMLIPSGKPCKIIVDHRCVCVKNKDKLYVYIIGGLVRYGPKYSITILTLSNDLDKYDEITFQPKINLDFVGHSVTEYKGQVLIYGGIDSTGKVLNDFYIMDPSVSPENPDIKFISTLHAPYRYLHSAWISGNKHYICGGLDKNKKAIPEMWELTNQKTWLKVSAFDYDDPLLCTEKGIANLRTAQLVQQHHILYTIDQQFVRLRKRYQAHPYIFSNNEPNEINSNLLSETTKLIKEIEENLDSMFCKEPIPVPSSLYHKFADSLTKSAKIHKMKFEKRKEILEKEIDLYNDQIVNLTKKIEEKSIIVNHIPVDDYEAFIEYQNTLPQKLQHKALFNYYCRQFRTQRMISTRIDEIAKIAHRTRDHRQKRKELDVVISEAKQLYLDAEYKLKQLNRMNHHFEKTMRDKESAERFKWCLENASNDVGTEHVFQEVETTEPGIALLEKAANAVKERVSEIYALLDRAKKSITKDDRAEIDLAMAVSIFKAKLPDFSSELQTL